MVEKLPVYIQIHDQIKANIENNTYKIGDRLPSERELSKQFGVSRMTLRQAIQTLADEGFLSAKSVLALMWLAKSTRENDGHDEFYRNYEFSWS